MTAEEGYRDPALQETTTEARVFDGKVYGTIPGRGAMSIVLEGLEEFKQAVGSEDCMVIAGPLGDVAVDSDRSTESEVQSRCADRFPGFPWKSIDRPLHVILDSRGGSLDSSYKSLLYMRRCAKEIRLYVPRHAKSAAMIMAVGADALYMSPLAELGPLDTQLKDPRNPTLDFSVLDCYQSVDYVREFGLSTLPLALKVLLREAPLGVQAKTPSGKLVSEAIDFALGGVTPMLEQVKALDFGSWGRNLKIGETYAISAMSRLKDERADERVANRIARQLVYGYTHHPYPIDVDEAIRIGLHVTLMEQQVHDAAHKVAEACEGSAFVGFAEDAERLLREIDESDLNGVPAIPPQREEDGIRVRGDVAEVQAGLMGGRTDR